MYLDREMEIEEAARAVSVWPTRRAGAGSSWRREVVGVRGGVSTAARGVAVATIDVGRGGGGVLGVAGRVAWAQRGRGNGEEHKEEDGTGIYIPHPLLPVPAPHRE